MSSDAVHDWIPTKAVGGCSSSGFGASESKGESDIVRMGEVLLESYPVIVLESSSPRKFDIPLADAK